MLYIFALGMALTFSSAAFATSLPVGDSVVRCFQDDNMYSNQNELNSMLSAPSFMINLAPEGKFVEVRKPYSVSAPAIQYIPSEKYPHKLCVTITKLP